MLRNVGAMMTPSNSRVSSIISVLGGIGVFVFVLATCWRPLTDIGVALLAGNDYYEVTPDQVNSIPSSAVRVSAKRLSDADIEILSLQEHIEDLDLAGNKTITDKALEHVGEMKELKSLFLGDTNITDTGLRKLEKSGLVMLNLRATRISDAGMLSVSKIISLRQLHVNMCNISDVGVRNLRSLDRIETLNISETSITDVSLRYLLETESLAFLIIWRCDSLTDKGINEFQKARPDCKIMR